MATESVLLQFSNLRSQIIERYQTYISQGVGQEIWHDLKHQIYLGDGDFVERNLKRLSHYEGKLSEVHQK